VNNLINKNVLDGGFTVYESAMNFVESFIISSGIRKYCSEICEGGCCRGCNSGPHKKRGKLKCWLNGKERVMMCSLHICGDLRSAIMRANIPKRGKDPFNVLKNIESSAHDAMMDYFVYDASVSKALFKIPMNSITGVNPGVVRKIRSVVNVFIRHKVKCSDLYSFSAFIKHTSKHRKRLTDSELELFSV